MTIKRSVSFILVLALVLSLAATALAAEPTKPTAVSTTLDRADALKDMGLFAGTNTGYDLEGLPTRTQAIIFLLRMLGEEKTAQNSSYTCPFTDVPAWALKDVAYAYNKGYTSGTGKTTFGANDLTTPAQFFTFMLRALGYSDKSGDFVWSASVQKAESLSIVPVGKYAANGAFFRGDCVDIIYSVLGANKKGETNTLAESLIAKEAIDGTIAAKYGFYTPAPAYQMVKVDLKKATNGDWTIYGTDAIAAVPGAKYALFNWAGSEVKLGDYSNVYSKDDYQVMVNPSKDTQITEYLTANWAPLSQYPKFGQDVKIIVTVYDDKANMMAAGIAVARDAIAKGYIELAFVSVNGAELIAKQNADFEKAFGSPVEYKDAVVYIEKAGVNWTFISKKTGKVVSTAAYNAPGNRIYYRYAIDKTKYPELTEKVKYFGDNTIPAGKTAYEAIRDACLFTFKYNPMYDGTFGGGSLVTEFSNYSNDWPQKASEWNNARFVLFSDENKKLIGYTSIIPSQLKIVDVGIVDQTAYVD